MMLLSMSLRHFRLVLTLIFANEIFGSSYVTADKVKYVELDAGNSAAMADYAHLLIDHDCQPFHPAMQGSISVKDLDADTLTDLMEGYARGDKVEVCVKKNATASGSTSTIREKRAPKRGKWRKKSRKRAKKARKRARKARKRARKYGRYGSRYGSRYGRRYLEEYDDY